MNGKLNMRKIVWLNLMSVHELSLKDDVGIIILK